MDVYLDGMFQLVLSPGVLQELLTVLPEIRALHCWSDDKILQFVINLPAGAALYPAIAQVPASLPSPRTRHGFRGVKG